MESQQQNKSENAKSIHEAFVHDGFCWYCHTPRRFKVFSCSRCFRVFHDHCLKKNSEIPCIDDLENPIICPVCVSLKNSKPSVDKNAISDLLKQTMVNVAVKYDFTILNNVTKRSIIVNPINLDEIKRNIDSQIYDSFDAFLADINTILHNCCSVNQHKTTAQTLFDFCKSELKNISSCAECYKNLHTKPNGWQSLVCSQPHLVLWIESECRNTKAVEVGRLYSPAKLVSVGRENLKVIFFDGSKFDEIPRRKCFIYSKNRPKPAELCQTMPNMKNMPKIPEALNLYEQNIKAKFGHFETHLECVPFDRLDIHMEAMFPGYAGNSVNVQNHDKINNINENRNIFDKSDNFDQFSKTDDARKNFDRANDKAGPSTNNEPDGIPEKRQRLSEEIFPLPAKLTDHIAVNISSSKDTNSSKNCEPNQSNDQDGFLKIMNRLEDLKKNEVLKNVRKCQTEYQAKIDDLRGQLKKVTDGSDQANSDAKNGMDKLKHEHKKEITELEKEIAKLQQDNNDLSKDLEISQKKWIESEVNHGRELVEAHDQYTAKLDIEKKRSSDAIGELDGLKVTHTKKIDEFTTKLTKMEQRDEDLRNRHNAEMSAYGKKMEKNHENELCEIREKRKVERQQAQNEIIVLNQKVMEMEEQVQSQLNNIKFKMKSLFQFDARKFMMTFEERINKL